MDDSNDPMLPVPVVDSAVLDIGKLDPGPAFEAAAKIVQFTAARCSGPSFISNIQGKNYPKVEWWTTVGASLGMFPREESNVRLERDGETIYEATVAVYRGDQMITRASAVCSSRERRWGNADEYAIKSMAATRAVGKAFRIGLSFLAVMAGLQPTSAEEIPSDTRKQSPPRQQPAEPPKDAPPAEPKASDVKRKILAELANFPEDDRDDTLRYASHFRKDDGKDYEIDGLDALMKAPAKWEKWMMATLGRLREMVNERAAATAAKGESL